MSAVIEWICTVCGVVNEAGKRCEECGTDAPVQATRPEPPAPPPTAREEVAAMSPEERKSLMAELKAKCATAEARNLRTLPSPRKWNGEVTEAEGDPANEAHLPHERGTALDAAWRQGRAMQEIARLMEYCERNGIDWKTGRELDVKAVEEEAVEAVSAGLGAL